MPDNKGWIKLHRRLLDWEWYGDTNMVRLFVHLLLKANSTDRRWQGREIPRGSLVTSWTTLETETGLSRRTIRTCLVRLVATAEIEVEATKRFSIITVCRFEDYQAPEQGGRPTADPVNDQPNGQQTANQTAKSKGGANTNNTSGYSGKKKTSGQAKSQEAANQTTQQTALLKEYNNILVVADARAREELSAGEFLERHFNSRAAIEQACMALHIAEEDYRALAAETINEWELTGEPPHETYTAAAKHLVNQIRKKVAAAAQPKAQTRRRAYGADSREVNDRWRNSKYTPPKE